MYWGLLFICILLHVAFLLYTVFHVYLFFKQGHSKTRDLDSEELLEQLPALQQLLYRLVGCRVIMQNMRIVIIFFVFYF
jgi:hypothetical protein